jgi:uncharacterized coiled-coil DUF342 family protein
MDPRPDTPDDPDTPQGGDPRQQNPGQDSAGRDNPGRDAAGPENPGPENPGQDNPAEQIINLFGGIRPTANKLHVPVTTVQGWKKRGAIPEARHGDIRAAAEQHGIAVDPALLAASKPPEEMEGAEDRQPETGEAPAVPAAAGERAAREAEEKAGPAREAAAAEPAGPAAVSEPADQERLGEPGEVDVLAAGRRGEGEPSPRPEPERAEETPSAGPAGAAERAEPKRPEPPRPETGPRPERGGEPPERGQPPPPAARGGGGGGGLAWLAALIAVVAAAAGITAPLWGPQYLPDVWPGPVPDRWVERVEDRLQPIEERTERISGQVGDVATAREEIGAELSSLASRVEAMEALVADATGVSDARSLLTRIQDLETRLADMPEEPVTEEELAARIEEMRVRLAELPDAVATDEELAEAIDAAEGRLAEAPAELIAERLGPIAERLARLEDLPQEVERLRDQLEATGIDARTLAEMNGRLEGLSAAMTQAEERLREIARIAEARRAADIEAQALALAIGQLRRDLLAGESFGASLSTVRSLVGERPEIADQLDRIAPHAEEGIPTRNELAARFPAVLADIRRAGEGGDGGDAMDRALNTLQGLVRVRPAPGEVAGEGSESVLARAEHRVGTGNVAGAVAALDRLEGAAAEAASAWLDPARARLAAEEVLAALDAAALERLAAEGTPDEPQGGAGDGGADGASDAGDQPEGDGAAAPADQG